MHLRSWMSFLSQFLRVLVGQYFLPRTCALRLLCLCAISVGFLLECGAVSSVRAGLLGYPGARLQPRHLRVGLAADSFRTDFKETNSEATTGRALLTTSLGLTSWSEVFVRLGEADFDLRTATFKGGFGFAYGGGIRLRLWRFDYGELGLIGQYLRFKSKGNSAGDAVKATWEEFDIALGVGTRLFGAFQFYGGIAYHDNMVTLRLPNERRELKADIPARVFVGWHIYPFVDFPGGEFLVNIEARFISETPQITLGVQYQF